MVIIPRSRWLEQILPGTGYGKVHMMELPVIPSESCAPMKCAFEALKKAQSLEREGHYDDAITNCRKALEPFCESVEKPDGRGGVKRMQKLKAAWQTRLSQRTYDWLDSSLAAVRQVGNEAAHVSSTRYGMLEAQMLLLVTTALLAYAAQTMDQSSS